LFWKEEKKKKRERQGKKMSRSNPTMSRKAQRRTQSTSRLDRVRMEKYKERGEKGGGA
jgi:hypothetical protein